MPRSTAALAVMFASAVELTACSSAKRVTSIDQDKVVSSLSPDERRQLCQDRLDYIDSRVSPEDQQKIGCSIAAGSVGRIGGPGADTQRAHASCQQVYQVCRSESQVQAGAGGQGTPAGACDDFPAKVDSCAATVHDVSECAVEQADALEGLASKADDTCKDLGRAGDQSGNEASTKQDTCARLELLCPKVFEEPLLAGTAR